MRSGRTFVPVVIAALVCFGCSAGGPEHEDLPPLAVRDSAGVQIVENGAPAWDEGEGWSIDPVPVARIGSPDAPAPEQFSYIAEHILLPGDRIAAVDGYTYEIRVFEPDGRHLVTLGRAGGGPGEFSRPPEIGSAGEASVFAYDPGNLTLTTFGLDGAIMGVQPLKAESAPAPGQFSLPFRTIVGFLLDGGLVGWQGGSSGPPDLTVRVDTTFHEPGILRAGGDSIVPLGRHPGRAVARVSGGVAANAWSPVTLFAITQSSSSVHWTGPGGWEIVTAGSDGAVNRVVRLGLEREPLTPEMIEAERQAQIAEVEEIGRDGRVTGGAFDALPLPDSAPAMLELRPDLRGHLWARRWTDPRHEQSSVWEVIDPEGRWLGSVQLEGELGRVAAIGAEHVLAIKVDEFDVETLLLYRIIRGGG